MRAQTKAAAQGLAAQATPAPAAALAPLAPSTTVSCSGPAQAGPRRNPPRSSRAQRGGGRGRGQSGPGSHDEHDDEAAGWPGLLPALLAGGLWEKLGTRRAHAAWRLACSEARTLSHACLRTACVRVPSVPAAPQLEQQQQQENKQHGSAAAGSSSDGGSLLAAAAAFHSRLPSLTTLHIHLEPLPPSPSDATDYESASEVQLQQAAQAADEAVSQYLAVPGAAAALARVHTLVLHAPRLQRTLPPAAMAVLAAAMPAVRTLTLHCPISYSDPRYYYVENCVAPAFVASLSPFGAQLRALHLPNLRITWPLLVAAINHTPMLEVLGGDYVVSYQCKSLPRCTLPHLHTLHTCNDRVGPSDVHELSTADFLLTALPALVRVGPGGGLEVTVRGPLPRAPAAEREQFMQRLPRVMARLTHSIGIFTSLDEGCIQALQPGGPYPSCTSLHLEVIYQDTLTAALVGCAQRLAELLPGVQRMRVSMYRSDPRACDEYGEGNDEADDDGYGEGYDDGYGGFGDESDGTDSEGGIGSEGGGGTGGEDTDDTDAGYEPEYDGCCSDPLPISFVKALAGGLRALQALEIQVWTQNAARDRDPPYPYVRGFGGRLVRALASHPACRQLYLPQMLRAGEEHGVNARLGKRGRAIRLVGGGNRLRLYVGAEDAG